jgi:hypothetical protein
LIRNEALAELYFFLRARNIIAGERHSRVRFRVKAASFSDCQQANNELQRIDCRRNRL